ncbi:glycosyltransferase [Bacillus marasmi]|uniref:glycosyltransferase n=1 Tax=Bacillus marasmi TaxID=1926279 RepID=UPI00164DF990|nr:glycosyltransferase [Bacillus marasmi]
MKKVLISIDSLGGGGAEKVLINLLKHLNKDKYEVTLLLLFNEGIYLKEVPKHVKIKTIFNPKGNIHRRILYKLFKFFSAERLYKTFIQENYDVEIAFLEGSTTKLISGSPNSKSKKIAWVHTDFANYHWSKHYYKNNEEEKKQYKKFNDIIFVSNDSLKGFEKTLLIHDKLSVIYNPIDADEISNKSKQDSIKNDMLTVISVGRLIEQKGYDRLIKVHSQLIKEGIEHKLVLIGEGEEKTKLNQLCDDLHVSKSVVFAGFQTNPYKYVNAADVYVSSSRVEGLPLVVAEALILGKPILCTRCSGPVELLDNGKYGMIVDNSEQGIYDGLKELLLSEDTRKQYAKLALQRKSFFDINKIICQIEQLIDDK